MLLRPMVIFLVMKMTVWIVRSLSEVVTAGRRIAEWELV